MQACPEAGNIGRVNNPADTLQAEPSAKTRTELLQRATIEYQSQTDLAPFAPDSPQHSILSSLKVDSPQNSVKSRLNALFAKPPPTEVCSHSGSAARI